MVLLNINANLAPGVYVTEDTAGYIPTELSSFNTTYMVGSSATGAENEPVQVVSVEDFTNVFGTSASLNPVKLYFANNPNGVLFFVRITAVDDAAPTAAEFVAAIQNSFDEEMPQGFLIAPQAFSQLTVQGDRTSVATAMENLASKEGFDWMALVDSGPSGTIDTHAEAVTEGQLYTSERGHLAYFFPYVIDLLDNVVPPSAAIAGLAIRRYKKQGFQEPPAGAKFPLKGVKDVAVKVTKAHQEIGNPLGINAIRKLPNKGVVCWGSRTRSSSEYYRFVTTRVIFNVLSGTARGAFDSEVFSSVDGQGEYYTRIKETLNQIGFLMWRGKALYGQTPKDAYEVKCDHELNQGITLEAGAVIAAMWAAPSPVSERIFIQLYRTTIGQVQVAAGSVEG
ncbi:phage tail sheath family protein [Oculatella sp. LEGE 06141]|uniref:phage tail sheath subtilisin-like domain-containing protein n=1 Tax=Oculatella sp. LEGE 06141 TaxID=1828648 RepID=UPI001880849E|nr:phage tail sheath subtilisin-like domain-containing protein [Oculatella sp. LEGE 06141]MBE9178674.1 phage tail sheath family protein [Oculatella sp. LEGE 06141]